MRYPDQGLPGEEDNRQNLADALKATPKLKRGATVIEAARHVREHGCIRYRGLLLDATTASMLIVVYDALSPENQTKFAAMDLRKAVAVGWKMVK